MEQSLTPDSSTRPGDLTRSSSLTGPELCSWRSRNPAEALRRQRKAVRDEKQVLLDSAPPADVIALTCALGVWLDQVQLCVGCCTLGLAAGRILRTLAESHRSHIFCARGSEP